MKFNELIKNEQVLRSLEEMNIVTPTEIQEKIIPIILDGNDVLGQSQTGTGKTIAFALPILENIIDNSVLQTIILAPTRELAIQIERDFEKLAKYTDIDITCVYGSSSIEEQIKNIRKGPEVIVGTPGRVMDLIKRRIIKLSQIRFFVLDEADEMLSMGFKEELEFIFNQINNDKQVFLFSATMPDEILKIAKNYMSKDYKRVMVAPSLETRDNISQEYYLVNRMARLESLCRIVDYYTPTKCIIFCKTKKNADEVLESLSKKGYSVDVIHGDITQGARIATLDRFKEGVFNYLIATDVAARGIHVDDVDIVINYSLPENNEAYVHRIGRTGRANKKGLAITLVTSKEESIIVDYEKHVKSDIIKKELPGKSEIMSGRVNALLEEISNYKELEISALFTNYLNTVTEEELKHIMSKLLLDKLNSTIGSDFSQSTEMEKKKKHGDRVLNDSTRVFLTIGKMDNIEKRDFLCFLEKKADVPEGTFTGTEIMPKFTFLNVNNKHLDKVLKKCNDITYKNRLVRIEIAKKSH